MRAHYLPLRSGDEEDALTSWRKVLRWSNGARKKTKRHYNRRIRRDGRKQIASHDIICA